MSTRQKAIDFVLEQEGGYVNDAIDLGGATNFGISLRFLKGLDTALADIDHDGDIDGNDILRLTQEGAAGLYRSQFWDKLGLDSLPGKIAMAVMDTAVNMGRGTAVRLLQRAVSQCGAAVVEDGVMGTGTIGAVTGCPEKLLLSAFLLLRVWRYQEIVSKNRSLGRFLLGWLSRVRALETAIRI